MVRTKLHEELDTLLAAYISTVPRGEPVNLIDKFAHIFKLIEAIKDMENEYI